MFMRKKTRSFTKSCSDPIHELQNLINNADKIVIGAGSGLSSSVGLTYDGTRFDKYFFDFKQKYGIQDMYSGGFYSFPMQEEFWTFWSRVIWINRYMSAPKKTYQKLMSLIGDRDYFVITTNVDHQFQKNGFDKNRLFYTQGDYGLFEKIDSNDQQTYDNYSFIKRMILAQGFRISKNNELIVPVDGIKMKIPEELIPKIDNLAVRLNLRIDDNFVQGKGWYKAANRYQTFLSNIDSKRVLYLELGVGMNTPAIIKYPFWELTIKNNWANYVSISQGKIYIPEQAVDRSLAIKADIDDVFNRLLKEGRLKNA